MNLGDVLWAMLAFFFWFMVIWMFIGVFADIFRRDDLSGWGKAGWILLIFVLPLLGIPIYMIARPKMTEQDRRMMTEAQEQQRRMTGYSAADETSSSRSSGTRADLRRRVRAAQGAGGPLGGASEPAERGDASGSVESRPSNGAASMWRRGRGRS